jgi:predicted solute-binding protein
LGQHFKIMPTVPLQLGWIPYWNLHPLRHELERSVGNEVEFHKGHPSLVNRWLSEGKVSLAPCSSVCLLKNPAHQIAFPLGIASQNTVASVYIGLSPDDAGLLELIRSRQALVREVVRHAASRYDGDARKLASAIFKMTAALPPVDPAIPPPLVVTPASAASATLARLLYRLWFGETIYDMKAADTGTASASLAVRRPMELLIGDEALAKRGTYRIAFDLGEAWRDLTDLPFVFAVWQTTKRTMSPYWKQRITEAAELAQARMRIEPSHYLPDMPATDTAGRPIDLAAYWKLIQYRLTPAHFKGLALYLAMARQLAPAGIDDQAVVNIMRWESMGADAR